MRSIVLVLVLLAHSTYAAAPLQVGMGRATMQVFAEGVGMYGYGQVKNVVRSQATPLHARAMLVATSDARDRVLFVSCELAFITQNVKDTVVQRLQERFPGDGFSDANVMLTATHTHAAPGGYAFDALYNITTGGYHCGVFKGVVEGIIEAVEKARDDLRPSYLLSGGTAFADSTEVAWNRALKAWNRNTDVTTPLRKADSHLALDRTMRGLCVMDEQQNVRGLVSWFGVHSTCVDNRNTAISYDNKGYASARFEAEHPGSVALFAQEKAGDVSPNYHGTSGKEARKHRRLRKADHGHSLARSNGELQATLALQLVASALRDTLSPLIDHELIYLDMRNAPVDPDLAQGRSAAHTAPACHGLAFTCGTPVDGKGAPKWVLQLGHSFAFRRDRRQSKEQRELLAPHGVKKIVINAHNSTFLGRSPEKALANRLAFSDIKRQGPHMQNNPLVQEIIPLQLFIIGELCIIGLPAEITTHAGNELAATVLQSLKPRGVERVVIGSYANSYVGYVTTYAEYQAQTYEGGHTLFGEWEHAALLSAYRNMGREMVKEAKNKRIMDRSTRPEYDTTELCGRSFKGACQNCQDRSRH